MRFGIGELRTAFIILGTVVLIASAAAYLALDDMLLALNSSGDSAASLENGAKVFYIVPTAWTFAIYDENFNKIEKIEVDRGDVVTIVVLPEPFVPEELHEEVEHEYLEQLEDQGLGVTPEQLQKYHEEAEENLGRELYGVVYLPHSAAIEGYGIDVDVSNGYPATVTFVADKPGVFDIYCNVFCGWGHPNMRLDGAFVVNG